MYIRSWAKIQIKFYLYLLELVTLLYSEHEKNLKHTKSILEPIKMIIFA